MTLQNNDLYSETTQDGLPAIQPDKGPGAVVVGTFKAGTADTLLPGCPVCIVPTTGDYDIIDPDQTSTNLHELVVHGFVWPKSVVRSATEEVQGTVMVRGSIMYSVISAMLTQLTGTEQQLKDVLRKPAVQAKGLHIDGLTKPNADAGVT